MKKDLPARVLGALLLLCLPHFGYCCFEYVLFSVTTPPNTTCQTSVAWTFNECGESGNYYIEYSTDGTNFGIIGTVAASGASGSASYTYTDNYAFPAGSSPTQATVEYRIVFVSPAVTLPIYSTVTAVKLTAANCSLNNVTRCSSLPSGLSITGPSALCSGASGSYSLSSSEFTIWEISSGSSLVTTSTPVFGGGVTVTNTNSTQSTATLTADVEGCLLSLPITLGIPAAPTQMFPNATNEKLPPGSIAEFNSPGATHWTVSPSSNGAITDGQGGDDIAVRLTSTASGTLTVAAAASDACGTSAAYSQTFTIQSDVGQPYSKHSTADSAGGSLSIGAPPAPANITPTAITLYPNPASASAQVLIPPTDFTRTFIRLYDTNGHLLQTIIPSGQRTTIDLTRRAKGLYIVEIFDGSKLTTQKLVRF